MSKVSFAAGRRFGATSITLSNIGRVIYQYQLTG